MFPLVVVGLTTEINRKVGIVKRECSGENFILSLAGIDAISDCRNGDAARIVKSPLQCRRPVFKLEIENQIVGGGHEVSPPLAFLVHLSA